MSEAFALIGLILSLAALFVGAEFIRRLNVQHVAIRGLNERLLASEIRAAEQEQSIGRNMKSLERLKDRQVIYNARMAEQEQLLNRHAKAMEFLGERFLAGEARMAEHEMRMAEQKQSYDRCLKTLQKLERHAAENPVSPLDPAIGAVESGDGKSAP